MLMNLYFLFFLVMAASSILVSNPVLSVLCLVFVFVLASTFMMAMGLDYLGMLLLLIYVGAMSVLFLFVVMMLNVSQTELNQSLMRFWWLGVIMSAFFFFELILCVAGMWTLDSRFLSISLNQPWTSFSIDSNNMELIGEFLFLYNWDFLMIAILLLLVAVLGPVYVSQMEKPTLTTADKISGWAQMISSKMESSLEINNN